MLLGFSLLEQTYRRGTQVDDFNKGTSGILFMKFPQIFLRFLLFFDKRAGVVAIPDGVWHRDSHYRGKFIGGGTQDTHLNKGRIGKIVTKFLRRRNGGESEATTIEYYL